MVADAIMGVSFFNDTDPTKFNRFDLAFFNMFRITAGAYESTFDRCVLSPRRGAARRGKEVHPPSLEETVQTPTPTRTIPPKTVSLFQRACRWSWSRASDGRTGGGLCGRVFRRGQGTPVGTTAAIRRRGVMLSFLSHSAMSTMHGQRTGGTSASPDLEKSLEGGATHLLNFCCDLIESEEKESPHPNSLPCPPIYSNQDFL